MMAMRIPIQVPSALEIVISITLLSISAVAMIWIAGKIFRTAILSYGKRPSLPELLALIRAK
jgi:ABC-2 type transport system permease protein